MTAEAATTHYTPADVFRATGISVPKQNQWYDRGTIKPSRLDKKPTGSGSYRLVCAATVYRIAITATCANIGMPATQAADAARLFADEQPGRQANKPYEFGRTLLVTNGSGSRIVNAGYNDSLIEICGRDFEAAVIVDVGQIIRDIDAALQLQIRYAVLARQPIQIYTLRRIRCLVEIRQRYSNAA
jgi:hypothetical protein